jgi:hypothetical protein
LPRLRRGLSGGGVGAEAVVAFLDMGRQLWRGHELWSPSIDFLGFNPKN